MLVCDISTHSKYDPRKSGPRTITNPQRLLLINEELCTETESKHSEKPDRAIQQCNFIPFESKKNWGLHFACFFLISLS